MQLIKKDLLAFDDVWLVPQYNELASRSIPNLSSTLSPTVKLDTPIIASNMSTVVNSTMARTLERHGSLAIMHRFLEENALLNLADCEAQTMKYFAFSVGIKNEDLETAKKMHDKLSDKAIILVDIAHGHSLQMGKFVTKIKNVGYHTVIAGNVATKEGYDFLCDHGADAVRVGVAGGSACTTKYVTGHHIPTLTSVMLCANRNNRKPIIADGGIRNSGDAVKCLAAGASFVCLGSVLASTSDAPGDIISKDGEKFKEYYGMSSQKAIDTYFKDAKKHVAPEGKVLHLPYTGETDVFLKNFIAGIKSGLTYSGAENIQQFQQKAQLYY